MLQGILAIKLKQTQTFTEQGMRIPVTVLTAGPCWVTQVMGDAKQAKVQLGFGSLKHITKAQEGIVKKAGITQKPRFLREIASVGETVPTVGETITVDKVFAVGDKISVTGTSKGKGYAGVVKRHGFRGMPRTHGTSDRERAPGSIGSTTTPGRVFKGKRMSGRMGNDQVTVQGLRVIAIDATTNQMTISGVVPGGKSGLLLISKA